MSKKFKHSKKTMTVAAQNTDDLFAKLAKRVEKTDRLILNSRPVGPLKYFGIGTEV